MQKMSAGSGLASSAATRPSRAVTWEPSELKVATSGFRLDLDHAAVAQDLGPSQGRPEEQAADDVGRELVLDDVEEAVALGHRGVVGEVPGVEGREVVVAQVAPIRFRLFGVGVAGELQSRVG